MVTPQERALDIARLDENIAACQETIDELGRAKVAEEADRESTRRLVKAPEHYNAAALERSVKIFDQNISRIAAVIIREEAKIKQLEHMKATLEVVQQREHTARHNIC